MSATQYRGGVMIKCAQKPIKIGKNPQNSGVIHIKSRAKWW